MERKSAVPVAQYLRMSTEHQQYSLENQAAVLHCYAQRHGLAVVETFSDGGRSGVLFKNRPELNRLLQQVLSGEANFEAILVYDVSRWGRFQDSDEAAHYEFLCKRASIPVHYCAEEFANDKALTNSVMKAIKRMMAAEFSRELGVKIFSAETRLTQLGFKQGGAAGFALQRVMVSSDGKRKQILNKGEVKNLQSDRVILEPGNPKDIALVKEMYRLVIEKKYTPHRIARYLNEQNGNVCGRKWNHQMVGRILTDPKYSGACVWNRSTRRLGTPNVVNPRSSWVVTEAAFKPVIEPAVFAAAQRILDDRICRKSDEQIIEMLRTVLASTGRLTGATLQKTPGAPSILVCRRRFGSLKAAFDLARSKQELSH
jgi:DNA invertase Pin-like site-specific DNA recombinase